MEACLLQTPGWWPRSSLRKGAFSLSPSPICFQPSFGGFTLPLSARREVLTPRARASGEAGTAEPCARPPMEGSGGGGRLCALAHARSPANSGLNAAGSRGGDFFFPFERAREAARRAFSYGRAPVRTRVRSALFGRSAERGVGGLTALLGESSRSIPKVGAQALLLRSSTSHRSSQVSPHTPHPSLVGSLVVTGNRLSPSFEEEDTPSLRTRMAGTPECVGTRV